MDTVVWVLSKIMWVLVNPENILLISLVVGAFLLFTDRKDLGRRLVTISSVAILLFSIFPWDKLVKLPLENRFAIPEPLSKSIDGIIVLGGPERIRESYARGQAVLRDSAERLTTFVGLSRRYPEAKLIYSGGSGNLKGQEFKGSYVAKILFEQLGLGTERVLFESESRNTLENAKYSFDLAKPQKGEKWVLVTSASHMPRAVGVFRKVGWPVIPYPVDYSTTGKIEFGIFLDGFAGLSSLSSVLREWVGIVAYWFMGRTSELFPGPGL
jgi:uncharacterized SAM-binding protein YcdF (DUF218 family)